MHGFDHLSKAGLQHFVYVVTISFLTPLRLFSSNRNHISKDANDTLVFLKLPSIIVHPEMAKSGDIPYKATLVLPEAIFRLPTSLPGTLQCKLHEWQLSLSTWFQSSSFYEKARPLGLEETTCPKCNISLYFRIQFYFSPKASFVTGSRSRKSQDGSLIIMNPWHCCYCSKISICKHGFPKRCSWHNSYACQLCLSKMLSAFKVESFSFVSGWRNDCRVDRLGVNPENEIIPRRWYQGILLFSLLYS